MQSFTTSITWTCIAALLRSAGGRLLTQDDYTLYFDEYHFDWSNGDDWHVITADNTLHDEGTSKAYTKIVACTLHIDGLKKNLCVHTKAEGGFTLKFQDFPHLGDGLDGGTGSNSAHTDLENEFESFLKSQYSTNSDYDFLDDLELDFNNDDDWSEVNSIWKWNVRSPSDIASNSKQSMDARRRSLLTKDMYRFYDDYYDDDDGNIDDQFSSDYYNQYNGFNAFNDYQNYMDYDNLYQMDDYNADYMNYGDNDYDDYLDYYYSQFGDYNDLENAIDEEFLFNLFKKGKKALKHVGKHAHRGLKHLGRGGRHG